MQNDPSDDAGSAASLQLPEVVSTAPELCLDTNSPTLYAACGWLSLLPSSLLLPAPAAGVGYNNKHPSPQTIGPLEDRVQSSFAAAGIWPRCQEQGQRLESIIVEESIRHQQG